MTRRNSLIAGVGAIALALASAASAAAEAHGNASCIGFEASGISPPGSSDEFPGGMPELQQFVKDNLGKPSGAIVSAEAKRHAGSHEACDAGE
jgi:ABC-type phosphate/phosphonate transport system substrate-binding protein